MEPRWLNQQRKRKSFSKTQWEIKSRDTQGHLKFPRSEYYKDDLSTLLDFILIRLNKQTRSPIGFEACELS